MNDNLDHKQKINLLWDLLLQIKSIWIQFGLTINKIIQPLIMGLIFLFIFISIGIFFKYRKRDLLRLNFYPLANSYWCKKQKFDPKNMKYQF